MTSHFFGIEQRTGKGKKIKKLSVDEEMIRHLVKV
jgi:hypothetical protein